MGEFLEFWGISYGFPFFDHQLLRVSHPLLLGTKSYVTPPVGAHL